MEASNVQKMQRVLAELYDILDTWSDHLPSCLQDRVNSALEEADAALALHLRNCDVGTPEEQGKRFRLFCESHKPAEPEFTETGELLCPVSGCELGVCNYGQCALKWAQMPYEEGDCDGR